MGKSIGYRLFALMARNKAGPLEFRKLVKCFYAYLALEGSPIEHATYMKIEEILVDWISFEWIKLVQAVFKSNMDNSRLTVAKIINTYTGRNTLKRGENERRGITTRVEYYWVS